MTTITESNVTHGRNGAGHGRKIILLCLSVLFSSAALTWAWNGLASEFLHLPVAQFRHGLAVTVAGALLAITLCAVRSLFASQRE